jgi:hypothetical protein
MSDDFGGWEEWMAFARWWDGSGTTRLTLGVAGYCLRAPLGGAELATLPISAAFLPNTNNSAVQQPGFSTSCKFYPLNVPQPTTFFSPAVPAIFLPFRGNPMFYSFSYLIAMPSLLAAYITATLAALILPILCAGPESRKWSKILSWCGTACLIAGFGTVIGFLETWKNGMLALNSSTLLPGVLFEGQQFQYGGGFGAGIGAVLVALCGVQVAIAKGFEVPEKKRAGEDEMYDWMD